MNDLKEGARDFAALVPSKKIALIFGGTFAGTGGMFEYGRAWRDQLKSTGWTVSVVASRAVLGTLGEPYELAIDVGAGQNLDYRMIALSSLLATGAAKRLLRSVLTAIELTGVDAVHFVDRAVFSAFLAKGVLKFFPGMTIITTVHDPVWHDEHISRAGIVLKARDDRMLLKMAKREEIWIHVHAMSLVRGSAFEGIQKVIAVDHPAPLARVRRVRREIRFNRGARDNVFPIRVGFAGRIETYKGLDVFLEAVSLLVESDPEIGCKLEILIAGRGNIEKGLTAHLGCPLVLRNEFIEDEEFHQLVADLDLLVLPYKTATQSGVAMLGLTYRIPMIVTNVGGLPLLVRDKVTGYVMKRSDAGDLAALLVNLLGSPRLLVEMRSSMR